MTHALLYARWETEERWYEVEVLYDLLGDLVSMRRWGGKGPDKYGKKTVLISREVEGRQFIEKIHNLRLRRKPPYWRVY
jgi:hypothetical protein